jgi:NADPH:quinone reductase-like Zn-dependent oxidoreductase
MKAMHVRAPGGLDRLEAVELPDPGEPGPGEVRVRIEASSLNYHDYRVVTGATGPQDRRIPLADGAGVVESAGSGVSELKAGDAVVSLFFPQWREGLPQVDHFRQTPGDGVDGYARQVVVAPAAAFTRAPAGYSPQESATLTTAGLTAWRALAVNGGVRAGQTVLVLGTGGVSVFALQLARAMGATVIATSSSDAKLERMRALGAAHTVNYQTRADWGRAVSDWTGGRGVDHVIEVGGAGTLAQSIEAVAIGGHISLIGALTGRSGDFPTVALLVKQARLQGLVVGSRADQLDLVRALDVTGVRPVIDSSFALEDLAAAFRHQASGRHFGKVVVTL